MHATMLIFFMWALESRTQVSTPSEQVLFPTETSFKPPANPCLAAEDAEANRIPSQERKAASDQGELPDSNLICRAETHLWGQ